MGVAQLTLDQWQRGSFVQHLDRVRMAQLMAANRRRMPALRATWGSSIRAALADPVRPRVGPSITENSGPPGSSARSTSQGSSPDQPGRAAGGQPLKIAADRGSGLISSRSAS
jgi:hypothetical protein